jgi:hypothetical protein
MELTLRDVPAYLVRIRLATAREIVSPPLDARPFVLDYARRNRNFKVVFPDRPGLLVKQPMSPRSARAQREIALEARLLRAFAREPRFDALRPWVPQLVRHDRSSHVLATRLVHPSTTLQRYHERQAPPAIPVASSRTVGTILAILHAQRAPRGTPAQQPAVWRLSGRLARLAAKHGPRAVALLRRLRQAPYRRELPRLREAWEREARLVHGDARAENFLLASGDGPRGDLLNVRLVDWELARRGDPAWDVAYALADAARFACLERLPPETVRAWAGELARAYARAGGTALPRVPAALPHALALSAFESALARAPTGLATTLMDAASGSTPLAQALGVEA